MTRGSRRLAAFACLAALLAPGFGRAAGLDYEWALPDWRATWAAPRLADNRGFAVRASDDAVYVAGVTGSHGLGAGDLFLLRYDLAGHLVWERTWGGFELDQAQGMVLDGSNIWVAGSRTTDDGLVEAALLRFSTAGDLLLEKTWSMGVLTVAQAVAISGDRVFVAGLHQPTRATRDVFVKRFDLDGNEVWTYTLDGGGWDEAWDVAVDSNGVVYVSGYTSEAGATSQALLLRLQPVSGTLGQIATWGGPDNDEARALEIVGDAIYVTGGAQTGRSTDVFVARLDKTTMGTTWIKTTGGQVVGGGGYGIAAGERGIYVAGGSYDFPAGGDSALMRFSFDGALEWTQVAGLPGFWDWNFDVDVRDGRFYVAGVLWQPGAEWYRVTTYAYREDYPLATLTRAARWIAEADPRGAAAMEHFSFGDFLRWAEGANESASTGSSIEWEGVSDNGRSYGHGWIDTERDPPVGEENSAQSITDITKDFGSGNYALVRDWTSVHGSILGGLIRFRYTISHDRLIPQGGYVYVGELGVALPPPPV
jgi:hypothetical protein